jgi:hypothetical protein
MLARLVLMMALASGDPHTLLSSWENLVEIRSAHSQAQSPELGKSLLIAVVTAPTHFYAREVIRNTWARDAKNAGIHVNFFMGKLPDDLPDRQKIETRLLGEGDLIRSDSFVESYHNLTAKAISIINFASMNSYQGLLKVDDDSYVRVDHLTTFLGQFPDWSNLYSGQFVSGTSVVRHFTVLCP